LGLILTYRTGYGHPFGDRTYHTRIGLTALSPTETVVMAQSMLAIGTVPEEVKALIIRKAEGNPFFVEEVIKALRDVGILRVTGPRYVPGQPLDAALVPDTIQDVIMARIDRLDEAPKKALQLASVIGREFPRRLLDRLWDLPDGIEESVRQLKAGELIYEKSVSQSRPISSDML
jgi:predicted ATPase